MTRFCVLCIALIAIIHLLSERIFIVANDLNPVCNTTECRRLGTIYLQNMDEYTPPCSDFYDHVCSNWGMHNPRPKELDIQFLWNVDHSLEWRALYELRKLLESNVSFNSSEFEQAKLLYKTCMLTPYMERSSPKDAWNVMKKISPFPILLPKNQVISPRPLVSEIDDVYIQTTGESALFDFYPLYDTNTSEIITNLQYLPTSYGSLMRPVGWPDANELEHYKAFLITLIRSVAGPGLNISNQVMEDDLNAVIKFREKLNTIISRHALSGKTNTMTIEKFQSWYASHAKPNQNADINWLSVIQSMYKNSDNTRKFSITKASKVKVHTTYFSKLATLLEDTSKRVIVNHILLYFAEKHVEWSSQMKDALVGSVFNLGDRVRVRSGKPRWRKCIDTNNLRTAIGKVYVSSFFQPEHKANVEELFDSAKKLMATLISQSTWLNNKTKTISLSKLADAKGSIGYPDFYDGAMPIKSMFSELDPTQPVVLSVRERNEIIFSAAVLQWPIYSPNVPYVIDYGSLVSMFGHELHHLFDAIGIYHDAKGKTPFWMNSMILQYEVNAKCFREQMNKYKQKEVRELTQNTQLTTIEDISDVMGLKLAYAGFKEMLKKNNGVCPILPGFEKFGCEKLFFYAFANNYCSASLPGYNEMIWFKQGQNMPKVKINFAVANMKEFRTAFRCTKDDTLYLGQTCDLWQFGTHE